MFSAFLKKIKDNIEFRIKLFLLISLIFNFGYAIFLFIVSQVYFSKWFFVMSLYYTLLSTARIFIFFEINPKSSLRKKNIDYACLWLLLAFTKFGSFGNDISFDLYRAIRKISRNYSDNACCLYLFRVNDCHC